MSKMRFFALQELANRRPLEVITPSNKLSDYYGSHVFDRKKMQEYLPKETDRIAALIAEMKKLGYLITESEGSVLSWNVCSVLTR